MRKTILPAFMVFTTLALVGCQEQVDPAGLDVRPALAMNGVTQSATGSGHIHLAGGTYRTFSFNAVSKGNGSANGHWQIYYHGGSVADHFDVQCLVVDGNTAYIGGTVTKATNPNIVGGEAITMVIDNGEGGSAPPDQIGLTQPFVPGYDALTAFCVNPAGFLADNNLNLGLFDVENGNVQVRGG